MSIHKSLKMKNTLERARNVFTRAERLAILMEDGRWQEGDSVLGLPKVRTIFKTKKKAKKPEELEGEEKAEEGADKKE